MANSGLANAKNAKNDEFYTQYYDIRKRNERIPEYNPDVFKDKTILLPCDDPEWSNFTKFFAQNFERFGLKKLISTSYAPESKKYKTGYQPSLFEQNDIKFDKDKTKTMVRYSFLTMMFLEMGKLTWKTYSGIIYREMEISEVQKSRISATRQTSL